jgi:hypothetical protein
LFLIPAIQLPRDAQAVELATPAVMCTDRERETRLRPPTAFQAEPDKVDPSVDSSSERCIQQPPGASDGRPNESSVAVPLLIEDASSPSNRQEPDNALVLRPTLGLDRDRLVRTRGRVRVDLRGSSLSSRQKTPGFHDPSFTAGFGMVCTVFSARQGTALKTSAQAGLGRLTSAVRDGWAALRASRSYQRSWAVRLLSKCPLHASAW